MSQEELPARTKGPAFMVGAMPLPEMYEFLRANLDYVGAMNAARRVLADDRAAEAGRDT